MLWRILDRIEVAGLALLLGAMTIITFVQVVLRYVFNASLTWALELTVVCFAWLILLGISYGIRVGSHIGVAALVGLMRPRAARLTAIVAVLVCMGYCVMLGYGGYVYVAKLLKIGILMQDLPIPRWLPASIVPAGFALAFLRFGQVLWRLLLGRQTTLHLADEAAEAVSSDLNARRDAGGDGPAS